MQACRNYFWVGFICVVAMLMGSGMAGAVERDIYYLPPDVYLPQPVGIIPKIPVLPLKRVCYDKLADPVVEWIGNESYTVGGQKFVRYLLSVTNRSIYPDELFAAAPDLAPCGLNDRASRTWVAIFDQDDTQIYGFCALGTADDLQGLWFAVADGQKPPASVRVVLWDRACQDDYADGYRSDLIQIDASQFAAPPLIDPEIKSMWDAGAPVIDGVISAGEWDGASNLLPLYDTSGLHRGDLHAKNDADALYLLLDMTGDATAGPNANDDYSMIGFDIGLDGVKTPYVDLKFATPAGTETPGIQWVVSESGWTGVDTTIASSFQEGFGTSAASDTPHKFYEYRLAYNEINIDFADVLANPEQLFHARIAIKVSSNTPNFNLLYPSSVYGSWAGPMIRVSLGISSLNLAAGAPIIAGIGLVPVSLIDQTSGLASSGPADAFPNLNDAPFGSHLRVSGNLDRLRHDFAQPVTHYTIGYCNTDLNACADLNTNPGSFNLQDWEFVGDVRTNYYWNDVLGRYELESVSPQTLFTWSGQVVKAYPMPDPGRIWYFPNLLFDWRTIHNQVAAVQSGKYKIHFFGWSNIDPLLWVNTLGAGDVMTVRIDNTHPVMSVNAISYNGAEIDRCGIVTLDDATDTLQVTVSAYDPDGYLNNFSLHALYGNNETLSCHAETYNGYLSGGGAAPSWFGAMPQVTYNCSGKRGIWETCGYTFRVSGWDRAINGYGFIHYNAAHKTITVMAP